MGRLIDADALIEEAKELHVDDFMLVLGMVNKQPTAYDVEKVIADLYEKFDYYGKLAYENKCKGMVRTSERYKSSRNAFFRSINIVRKGGAE